MTPTGLNYCCNVRPENYRLFVKAWGQHFGELKKKSQKINTKICQKEKKTRLKSTKEKDISN